MKHPLISKGAIKLKPKSYRPTGTKYSYESLKEMHKYMEMSLELQQEMGLGAGTPGKDLRDKAKEAKDLKLLDLLLKENPSFRVLELPDEDILPRFFSISGNTAREYGSFPEPPKVVMVKLEMDVDRIRFTNRAGTVWEAPIPIIPFEALLQAKKVRDEAPEAPMYLAYVPVWEEAPQEDPWLITELAGEFVKLYEWGGDIAILEEFIVEK